MRTPTMKAAHKKTRGMFETLRAWERLDPSERAEERRDGQEETVIERSARQRGWEEDDKEDGKRMTKRMGRG
jgi:hypothetical protein